MTWGALASLRDDGCGLPPPQRALDRRTVRARAEEADAELRALEAAVDARGGAAPALEGQRDARPGDRSRPVHLHAGERHSARQRLTRLLEREPGDDGRERLLA